MLMSFTVIFAALAFLTLIMVFGLTYAWKGLKTAVIAAGITFIVLAGTFVAIIYAIVRVMSN